MSKNSSHVAGLTTYKGREQVVLIIDVVCSHPFESGAMIELPYSFHAVGYILVDTKTGFHSTGHIKTHEAERRLLTTSEHWTQIRFSAQEESG
jgi:hypothetical protein